MEFFFREYPYLGPPMVVVVFLFSIWADFFRIKKKDIGIVTFAFGCLPLAGALYLSWGNALHFAIALISSATYIAVFVAMLKKLHE